MDKKYSAVFGRSAKAGQTSIEYIAGFLFFMFTLLFVVFNIIDRVPQYFDETRNTLMHETAWMASERAMAYASTAGALNPGALDNLSKCTVYGTFQTYSPAYNNSRSNYTYFKSLFGAGESGEFRLTISEFAILLPNGTSGINYTGLFSIDGSARAFEIFNYTAARYDGLRVGAAYASEGGFLNLAPNVYVAEKIDPLGKYAIISRALVDCGRPPSRGKTSAIVKRYAAYNGSIARMEIVAWR